MGVNKDNYVPSAGELTAHVRTALDASVRWLDRALAGSGVDAEAWDQRNFYARMILMRGLERGELLGWVLERDAQAGKETHRSVGLRQAAAYWQEARPDLHRAINGLRRAADMSPAEPAAREAVRTARNELDGARDWLTELAERLAATNRTVSAMECIETPEKQPSYGRDYL